MRHQKRSLSTILLVFLILTLVILYFQDLTRPLRIFCADTAAPLLKSIPAIGSTLKNIIPFASLREENGRLKQKIDLLSRKLEEAKILDDENRRLKNILGFKLAIPFDTIPAEVIGRDPSNWSNSLIIDKGSGHDIRQNKGVLSTKGLVGRVVEVGRASSKVILISDTSSKVGAVIQRNRQGGILVGMPDGMCKMIYIALDSDVAAGDRVVTAGFGTVFPKGILIGKVVKVGKEPGRLYKYAIVQPAQALSKVEEVLCIK